MMTAKYHKTALFSGAAVYAVVSQPSWTPPPSLYSQSFWSLHLSHPNDKVDEQEHRPELHPASSHLGEIIGPHSLYDNPQVTHK